MRTTSRGRRWLPAVLAGAGAAVMGLACGALAFGDDQPPLQTATTTTAPAQAASAAAPLSLWPAPSSPVAGPADNPVPEDLSFAEVAGVRLAVSDTAGPQHISGGLASGFARTQAGAALAAAHILVRIHPEVGADVFGPTLAHQVVGDDTEALVANVAEAYEQLLHQWPAAYGEPAGRLYLAIPGYRVDSFTDTDATVALLIEVPADGGGSLLGATTLRLRWQDGDWVLVAPAQGVFADTALVDETSGFTLWGS